MRAFVGLLKSKTFWGLLKSKTFWLNASWIGVTVLELFGQLDVVKSNPDLVAISIAVSNILIRFATSKPLHEK